MKFTDVLRRRLDGSVCVYCGEAAESDEHFPPRSVSAQGFILSACLECNSLAETLYPFDFKKRFGQVKRKLSVRYRHPLRYYAYTDDELREFDGNLAETVRLCAKAKATISKRLAWSVDDYFDHIGQSNVFAVSHVVSDITISSEKPSSMHSESPRRSRWTNKGGYDQAKCDVCGEYFMLRRPRIGVLTCGRTCRVAYRKSLPEGSKPALGGGRRF